MKNHTLDSNLPWWKFGHVWLVLAGPAVVVVASLVTFYLAATRVDPMVTEDYYRKGIEINRSLDKDASAASLAPAVQARNHAATGVAPAAKPDAKP